MDDEKPASSNGSDRADVDRLDSWKEIAAYLKRTVRTVQLWERTEGLPVRRHLHHKLGTVYAYKSEVDAWWRNRQAQLANETQETKTATNAASLAGQLNWTRLLAATVIVAAIFLGGWALGRYASGRLAIIPGTNAVVVSGQPLGRLLVRATSEGNRFARIATGAAPRFAVITPDGRELYVSNSGGDSVTVIRTATNNVSHTIPVGASPGAVAISPDGHRVYVATQSGNVSAIDTQTKTVTVIQTGAPVSDLALTPDGQRLFLALVFAGLKYMLVASREILPIVSPVAPVYLAVTPDGSRLYINYQSGGPGGRPGHDAISVLDIATGRFVGNISGPPNVGGPIAVSPDGSQVWAEGANSCRDPAYDHLGCPHNPGEVINVIRTSDNTVIKTLGLATGETSGIGTISFFPDGSRAIVGGDSLKVLDTTRFTIIEQLPIHGKGALLFSPDAKRAYYPVTAQDAVAVFELSEQSCLPPAGLLGWWPGDGTPTDLRNINHGKLENGAGFTPARMGQGFSLAGAKSAVSLGNLTNLSGLVHDEFTIAAWLKFSGLRGGQEFSILDRLPLRGHHAGWQLTKDGDNHFRFCAGNACVVSTTTLPTDAWLHVAATRSRTRLAIHVGGVLEGTKDLDPSVPPGVDGELRVGSSPRMQGFEGFVDELELYGRALAPSEIQTMVTSRNAGGCHAESRNP